MPLGTYGQTNPQGLDPWSIESVLAPLAVGGSRAEAQNMLGHYQIARDTAQGQYENDLAQQHQAFYDQLHQQLTEARMKQAEALLKTPGGARYLSNVGGSSGIGYGDNPAAMTSLADASDLAQSGVNFEKYSAGASSARTAGLAVDPSQMSRATGFSLQSVPTPAELRLQGDLARASATAAGHTGTLYTIPTKSVDVHGNTITEQIKIPPGATDEQIRAIVANHQRVSGLVNPPGSGLGNATLPGDDATAPPKTITAPTPPPPKTGLTNAPGAAKAAPTAAPVAAPPVAGASRALRVDPSEVADKTAILDKTTQAKAAYGLRSMPPGALADIQAQQSMSSSGAVLYIVKLRDGTLAYVGKNNVYRMPPAPGAK